MSEYILPNGWNVSQINDYETQYLYEEIFIRKVYESCGIVVKDGDTVLDIGANIGMFALSLIDRFPNIKIYSFEPSPKAFQSLTHNAALFAPQRIIPLNFGVAGSDGAQNFTYYPNSSVFSGFHANAEMDGITINASIINSLNLKGVKIDKSVEKMVENITSNRLKSESFTCELKGLSSFIKEYSIQVIDLLKVDAEKSEWEILTNLEDDDWFKVKQIVVEIHSEDDTDVCKIKDLLHNKGFILEIVEDDALKGTGLLNVYGIKN